MIFTNLQIICRELQSVGCFNNEPVKCLNVMEDNKLLNSIIDNSTDGIVYYSPVKNSENEIIDFRFEYMNDSCFRHVPGSRSDFIGKNFLDIYPYNRKSGMFDAFKLTAETGEPSLRVYFYNHDGIRGWYRNYVIRYEKGIIVYFSNDTEKTEMQIQIDEKTQRLENLLVEKDRLISLNELLMQETHHRVKNNLQIISSLLNLQGKMLKDKQAVKTLETSVQRIHTIALVHERLYREKNFSKVKIDVFISEIVQSLKTYYGKEKIKIILNINNLDLPINVCVNIGLILNELISNSLKHAFDDINPGEIIVAAEKKGSSLYMVVSDNGRGFLADPDFKNLTTLGMLLIYSLVEQMDGKISKIKDAGTIFEVEIPHLFDPDLYEFREDSVAVSRV